MLTFSLVAVLLYGMKSFGHEVVSRIARHYPNPEPSRYLGRRYSYRDCHGGLFWLLAGCVQLALLHRLFSQCSVINGTDLLHYSKSSLLCGIQRFLRDLTKKPNMHLFKPRVHESAL